jgi:hypothetical protein
MKTAWTRNFWTKTAAFLLAAALVPVMLAYAEGLAFSYGGMSTDFYTSDICLGAVSHEARYIFLEYTDAADNGYELEKSFPADDDYSNIRFRVTDAAGEEEFSNVGGDDSFCYSAVYEGREFSLYLVTGLPAQDGVYWAKVFFDKSVRWGEHASVMLIALGACELFLCIYLARSAGRREDGTIEAGWQEKIPFDLYLALDCCAGGLLGSVGMDALRIYADYYTPPYDLLVLGVSFCLAALALGLWITLCTRVKLGAWWRHTVVCYAMRLCWRALRAPLRGAASALARGCGRPARDPDGLAHGAGLPYRQCGDLLAGN